MLVIVNSEAKDIYEDGTISFDNLVDAAGYDHTDFTKNYVVHYKCLRYNIDETGILLKNQSVPIANFMEFEVVPLETAQ